MSEKWAIPAADIRIRVAGVEISPPPKRSGTVPPAKMVVICQATVVCPTCNVSVRAEQRLDPMMASSSIGIELVLKNVEQAAVDAAHDRGWDLVCPGCQEKAPADPDATIEP